jgi:hypothetical protein
MCRPRPSVLDGAVSAWLATPNETTSIEMAQGVAEPAATVHVYDVVSMPSAAPEPDAELITEPTPKASGASMDLSWNRAGAMAREQAHALREAAPVRTFLAHALGVHTDERPWRIGADGEEKVAAQLEKVLRKNPRWRILHAVPVGERGSDIDHVAIGPGGVSTINAKHHPGAKLWVGGDTFMVNGQRHPYIRNSRHEAKRAAKLLSASCGFPVDVAGVVVPVRADDVTVNKAPDDVFVVPWSQVTRWLRKTPEVLRADAIEAICYCPPLDDLATLNPAASFPATSANQRSAPVSTSSQSSLALDSAGGHAAQRSTLAVASTGAPLAWCRGRNV